MHPNVWLALAGERAREMRYEAAVAERSRRARLALRAGPSWREWRLRRAWPRWLARGRIRDLALRVLRLYVGLAGFGVSLALMVRARLGLDPWDVLHQGIARLLGVRIGWVVIAVSLVVLAAWVPLRQRPGFGTVSNAVVVGLVVNVAVTVIPSPRALVARAVMLAVAILVNGISTGLYIGAGLGPGPRDGLMTGLAARGHSIRAVRTIIEVSVLAIGFALGGSAGIGTVAYAVSIGPLVHLFLPRLTLASRPEHCPSGEGN